MSCECLHSASGTNLIFVFSLYTSWDH